jgi:hypothetical protein
MGFLQNLFLWSGGILATLFILYVGARLVSYAWFRTRSQFEGEKHEK